MIHGTRRMAFHGLSGLLLAFALSAPAYADPPDWAPAHGYRDKHNDDDGDRDEHSKHHHKHRVYHAYGRDWPDDYGIREGRCDHGTIGAVVGGVIGGVVGSQVSHSRDRTVAVIIGAAVGALIGHQIGRDMDDGDRACFGHSLELAGDGRPVAWANGHTGESYVVTPIGPWREGGPACRKFKVRTSYKGTVRTESGRACRSGDGVWQFR